MSSTSTNILGGTGTEAVRTWELCIKYTYCHLKTDRYFQKNKCTLKWNEIRFWHKHKDKQHYQILLFLFKKKKKKETQSSLFLFSLILYTTKYAVKLQKKTLFCFSIPILSSLYSIHFSICIPKLDYIYFYTTCTLFFVLGASQMLELSPLICC